MAAASTALHSHQLNLRVDSCLQSIPCLASMFAGKAICHHTARTAALIADWGCAHHLHCWPSSTKRMRVVVLAFACLAASALYGDVR